MEVSCLDWPSRFLVSAKSPDDWMRQFGSPEGPAPHLVDIEEVTCDCQAFERVYKNGKFGQCEHIKAAIKYREQFTERPKSLPSLKHE
jgi:hypothetical protein